MMDQTRIRTQFAESFESFALPTELYGVHIQTSNLSRWNKYKHSTIQNMFAVYIINYDTSYHRYWKIIKYCP